VRGVYLTRGDLPTRADWLRAGLEIAGAGAAVSGWDAVRGYDLGSSRPPVDDVLVLATGGGHRRIGRVWIRPSRRRLRVRRMVVAGAGSVPMADPARAIADTALGYRTLPPVRALVTTAVQRQLCTVEDLQRELDDGPRNGSAHLRRAIEDVSGGAASISEAELAELLGAGGLPPFELNVAIIDPFGRHIATADLLWRELRAVLEVDSREHHFLEPQWRRTMRRHNLLTGYGLTLMHYPPAEIRDRPMAVLAEIDAWLRGRAAELSVAYPTSRSPLVGTPLFVDQQGRTVA
jgi:hypothetical protein